MKGPEPPVGVLDSPLFSPDFKLLPNSLSLRLYLLLFALNLLSLAKALAFNFRVFDRLEARFEVFGLFETFEGLFRLRFSFPEKWEFFWSQLPSICRASCLLIWFIEARDPRFEFKTVVA